MPVIIDPSFTPPAPPEVVVGSDQRLKVTADNASAGCLLKATFAEQVLRTNLHLNPAWRVTSAETEIRRNEVMNPRFVTNANWTGVGDGGVPTAQSIYCNNVAAVAGDTWTAGIDITAPAGSSVTAAISPRGTAAGAFGSIPFDQSVFITIPAGTTQRISQVGTVGAGGDGLRLYLQISSGLVAGIVLSNPTLEKTWSDLGPLDGAMAAADGLTFAWTGTPDASSSKATGLAGGYGSPFQNYTGTPGAVGWTNGETFRVLLKKDVNGGIVGFSAVSGQAPIAVGDLRSGRFTARQVGGAATAYIAPRLFSYNPTPVATDTLAITTSDAAGVAIAPDATVDIEVATSQQPSTVAGTTRWILYSRNTIKAGTILEFSKVLLVAGGTPGTSFDGDTPANPPIEYRWTGGADASTSQEFIPAVVDGNGDLPAKVRFARADGSAVRSGDPALSPGGIAYAYDHEAILGDAEAWNATPIFKDGSEGSPTSSVALVLQEPVDKSDGWIKSTTDPSLCLQVRVALAEEAGRSTRVTIDEVTGSQYGAVSWDDPVAPSYQVTARTSGKTDYDKLVAILTSGPVLLQTSDEAGLPRVLHCIPVGDIRAERLVETGAGWDYRHWPLVLREIERPPTTDTPLRIPGNAASSLPSGYPTCSDLLAQVATCGSLIEG